MRIATWTWVSLILAIGGLSTSAWAVERELCGVRLGDKALSLLDRPGYGQPNYIGPLGTISISSAAQAQVSGATGGTASVRGRATGRSGPSGPTARGGRGGMRGGGMRGGGMRGGGMRGAAPGLGTMTASNDFAVLLTQGRGGGMRGGGMRGGGGGARGGGARGGSARRGGAGGTRGGARGGTSARGRTAVGVGGGGVQAGGMYWYYRRPGGALIVLTLNLGGEVTAITLSGIGPTPGGRTSKGIGLGNGYMDLIAQYGYPDQSLSSGTSLEMTYVDHGVRFSLDSMRVRMIEIGAAIAAESGVAPAAPTEGPPPSGMTPEELRGYL